MNPEIMAFLGSDPQEIVCTIIIFAIPTVAALYLLKMFIFEGGLAFFLKVAAELFFVLCVIAAVVDAVGGL